MRTFVEMIMPQFDLPTHALSPLDVLVGLVAPRLEMSSSLVHQETEHHNEHPVSGHCNKTIEHIKR